MTDTGTIQSAAAQIDAPIDALIDALIDIVLIDDHAIVRHGLRAILEREPDLKLSSGSDTDGLDLCAALMADHPDLGVLVLTTFIDDHLVLAAIHNGARGYIVKDVDTSALIRAIRDISRGGSASTPEARRRWSAACMPGRPIRTSD